MKQFSGNVLFVDRSDINTDEIIPAHYLNETTKDDLKPHLFEDLKIDDLHTIRARIDNASIVCTKENFGCGSSREHAPWALQTNEIDTVIAPSFARIFRQNMFNCGMLAIELPPEQIEAVFAQYGTRNDVSCTIDLDTHTLEFITAAQQPKNLEFDLNQFDESLVRAGGWVAYADKHY